MPQYLKINDSSQQIKFGMSHVFLSVNCDHLHPAGTRWHLRDTCTSFGLGTRRSGRRVRQVYGKEFPNRGVFLIWWELIILKSLRKTLFTFRQQTVSVSFPILKRIQRTNESAQPFLYTSKAQEMRKGVLIIEKYKFCRLLLIAKQTLPEGGKTCFVKE